MVEAFSGKWQVDLSTTTGLEEFGAALGFSQERIDRYKGLSYTVEFSTSGDSHTAKVSCALPGVPTQTYTFKLGETIDYKTLDGEPAKLIVTLDGNKLVENYKQEDKNREWTTTRVLDGNVMISTSTSGGKSSVQKLQKL